MAEPLPVALERVRKLLLDSDNLVRAVAAGRRKGQPTPWRRVEVRYVDLKRGRRLQVVRYDDTQAHTSNHDAAAAVVEELLAEPYANWHVETASERLHLRVAKSGDAYVSVAQHQADPVRSHDRAKARRLPEDHPVLIELGISDREGRIKPSRRAKYRQVEEFLRELAATVDDARTAGVIGPAAERPLRIADLGCGNAYLTFAAAAWLREERIPARIIGVDRKEQARDHNTAVARRLGYDEVAFVTSGIGDVDLGPSPDVVLALHACDTATDDALARAVRWQTPVILAAPCCHHDISRQLRSQTPPGPYAMLVRDGILRERFADTLTDALRAELLRGEGYRVDVVEFVDSAHTPRNTLLRAIRVGQPSSREGYEALVGDWHVVPRLAELL